MATIWPFITINATIRGYKDSQRIDWLAVNCGYRHSHNLSDCHVSWLYDRQETLRAPAERQFMRAKLGSFIREARREAGLTQEHLGCRLGLKGRAIYRWERDEAAPTGRHRRALIQEVQAVNPEAATKLKAALAVEQGGAGTRASAAAPSLPQPASPLPTRGACEELELAVLKMADELDLPARRVRRSLARLLDRMRASNLSFEVAQRELEILIAQD